MHGQQNIKKKKTKKKLLSTAQTLFELDYRINIVTTDGVSAVRTASEGVTLAAELHRSGLETRQVFLNVFALSLKPDLREELPLFFRQKLQAGLIGFAFDETSLFTFLSAGLGQPWAKSKNKFGGLVYT